MSPHEVREGRNTIFIGIDESYDTNIDGNFVLNSFIIFSEKEMESISNLVKNYFNSVYPCHVHGYMRYSYLTCLIIYYNSNHNET